MKNSFSHGIVLRSKIPYSYKFLILDQQHGMIEALVLKKQSALRMGHGMLLRYTLHERAGSYRCEDCEVMARPHEWVQSDIIFLHHVLEVAAHFLSFHQVVPEVFQLFSYLYKPLQVCNRVLFKKLFLCRFFSLVGIFPENYEHFPVEFFSLISAPIDTMVKSWEDLLDYTHITRWLEGCIAVHPYADRLKTTVFLTQMDSHEL